MEEQAGGLSAVSLGAGASGFAWGRGLALAHTAVISGRERAGSPADIAAECVPKTGLSARHLSASPAKFTGCPEDATVALLLADPSA